MNTMPSIAVMFFLQKFAQYFLSSSKFNLFAIHLTANSLNQPGQYETCFESYRFDETTKFFQYILYFVKFVFHLIITCAHDPNTKQAIRLIFFANSTEIFYQLVACHQCIDGESASI